MAPAVKTNVTELPESRVRVDAEVPAVEVERSLAQAARRLARDTRVPGFRKGKVPPQVFIRRVGREYVLDEAVRTSIGGWYADALGAAGVAPIGEPKLDLGDLPPEGEPLSFSIEIGVRPEATLGEYAGLEVGRREPEVDEQRVTHELEHLREQLAKLETAERAAGQGDFVVVDYNGSIDGEPFDGGEGHDQLIELGGGRLIPGFEEQLAGASAGEERTIDLTFPDD
jgi:trigger factor